MSLCSPKISAGVPSIIQETIISRSEKVAFMCFFIKNQKIIPRRHPFAFHQTEFHLVLIPKPNIRYKNRTFVMALTSYDSLLRAMEGTNTRFDDREGSFRKAEWDGAKYTEEWMLDRQSTMSHHHTFFFFILKIILKLFLYIIIFINSIINLNINYIYKIILKIISLYIFLILRLINHLLFI